VTYTRIADVASTGVLKAPVETRVLASQNRSFLDETFGASRCVSTLRRGVVLVA